MEKNEITQSLFRIIRGLDEQGIQKRYSMEFYDYIKDHTKDTFFDILLTWLELVQTKLDIHGKKILDVGCGFGMHGIVLTQYINEITCIDTFKPRLEIAREIADLFKEYKIVIKENDSKNIECEDSFFDIAYCNEFVSHTYDLEKVLIEIKRVLKKGGKIIITDCDKRNFASFRLRYFTLSNMYDTNLRNKRRKIIIDLSKKLNASLDDETIENMSRKTEGWAKGELEEMLIKYMHNGKRLKGLLSMYKPKFPFREPESGMYEERLFSPNEIKNILLHAGYSTAYRVPLSNLPSRFSDKLKHYKGKLMGTIDVKYMVVGVK